MRERSRSLKADLPIEEERRGYPKGQTFQIKLGKTAYGFNLEGGRPGPAGGGGTIVPKPAGNANRVPSE